MNCPYCDFHFKKLLVNAREIPDLAPVVCESCAQISLLVDGNIRAATTLELAAIQESPAWKLMIEPALTVINRNRAAKNSRNN